VAAAQRALHAAAQPRADAAAPFDLRTRAFLLAAFALLMPWGVVASVWDAYRLTGATVHVVALRKP
jgi:hypothetical protein